MSSILKALKKLEDEKAARKEYPHKIDAEILDSCVPERISSIRVILFAILLFVCGGGATYIYMLQNKEETYSPARTEDSLSTKVTLSSSLPMSVEAPIERIVPETIVAAEPETNNKQDRAASQNTALTHASLRPLSKSSRISPSQSAKVQRPKQLIVKNLPSIASKQKVEIISPPDSALQIPALKVNGIAFHDGLDSVAVVNGVPVSTGSSIEGVKIDEIQRDRVLFNYRGEKFIVNLGK